MKSFVLKPRLLDSLKGYNKESFMKDLMAGIIVGIVALPLAIAFGIASGVTPEKGIITAIVAGFIISALGGSKVQIGGPTGAFIVIIYGIVSNPAYGLQGLLIATMMAGVILIALGVFKLGAVIKFIPYPIIIGFTAGIAVTIFTTQVGDVLGLTQQAISESGEAITVPLKTPGDFIGKWICYAKNISTFNLWNFIVAIGSLLVIIFSPMALKRVPVLNKIPGSLYGILVGTLAVLVLKGQFGMEGIDTIGDRFDIQAQLPDMVVPHFTFDTLQNLLPVAFTIAILGAIESLLSAAVADGAIGDRHDSNTELVAQGVANVVTPLFGGIPATGALARTMASINNGGKSPVTGLIHAVVLLLIYLFLMPYAVYIPLSCLAAILVMVAYNMSEWRTFKYLLRGDKSDVAVLLLTFFLTVIVDLTVAIEVGVVLAIVLFVRRVMQTSTISVLEGNEVAATEDMEKASMEDTDRLTIPDGVEVYEIDGPFFFGLASRFEEFESRKGGNTKVRIIRMRKVPFIDSTGVNNLRNLCERTRKRGVTVILSGVTEKVNASLVKFGVDQEIGSENIFPHIVPALERATELASK